MKLGVHTALGHVQHGLAPVVLYQELGIAMRSPKAELCATPWAQYILNYDRLCVLCDHCTEPPVKIVALDAGP